MLFLRLPLTKITLRWVLVIPFVLQTIGAVGLVGYLSYRSGEQAVENLANQLMDEVSHRISDRLDNYLQTQQRAMAINAQAVKQGALNIRNFTQLQSYLWQQITLSPLLGSSTYVNERGEEIGYGRLQSQEVVDIANRLTGEKLAIGTVFLAEIKTTDLGKRKHYLVDFQGQPKKLIYTLDSDNRQLAWYRYGKAAKKQVWSPIYVSDIAPTLVIQAMAPVYNNVGEFQGLFVSNIGLSEIGTFLNQLNFAPAGKALIIDRAGNLVASSTLELPYIPKNQGEPQRLPAIQSQDAQTRSLAQQILQKYGNLRQLENTTQLSVELNGHKQFVQIAPYRDRYGLDWLVVTAIPASDFMRELEASKAHTYILCLLTLFTTVFIGIFTASRITKPIVRLSQASQALAQGEWQKPLSEEMAIAELKLLTQSFNQTAKDLKQAFDRAKLALNESEDKFAKIFRNGPDFAHIISFETGCYVEVNDRFLEMTGYSRAEVIGHTPLELGIIAKPETISQMCHILQTQQRVQDFELELHTKSGERKIGLISSEWIDLEGKRYILSVFKDYTERKQVELELKTARDLREAIFNESTDAIFLVELPPTRRILDCNQRAVTLFELDSKAELIGLQGNILQKRQFTEEELAEIAREIEQQGFWSLEIEYLTKKGNSFWGNLAVKMIEVAGQSMYLVRITDITNSKRIATALQQSEERFQHLAAASPGIIYTVVEYPSGPVRYEYLSPAFEEIHEISVASALEDASIIYNQIHPEDRLAYQQAVAYSIENMQQFKHEWRIITPSGKIKWIEANSRPERWENGEIAWHGIVQDISDRHQIEQMKDEFISVVSHELRTPLTAINGALGMLTTGIFDKRPERAKEMLTIAANNCDRLVRLVNDILDLERLESGKTQLVMESCEVADLMQQAIEAVEAIATQAVITLEFQPLNVTMTAAPDAIVQTLINLLSNAIKFSPVNSTVCLTAELENAHNNSYILFCVQDQGRGIPSDKLETIFNRFQQVDVSDARQKGGTGLGLAICKSIVQQHGGQIWVESVVGTGSTFYFTLPVNQGKL
ncbi:MULTISPECIES: PAS domain S-box protein [Calothrix]|uniref:histidine kinase n=2 Tax=Calothrix TaxID=1186 RepID=A0ABR8AJG2_9CYAN|nr:MULTISPECIES: PAS domain S-box protein [Calothrix]MBD2199924.1 PAS domain S-box protein [Calothrix parietina FACHB-288]MBD2228839.1 PAS domain S-box protein [Calothrix anomala FACHB-343]